MGRRMNFLVRRQKSTFWWFKMDVPARHRAAVGKTAWWLSLDTSDRLVAEQRVSEYASRYKQLIGELDGRAAASRANVVERFVEQALSAAAVRHGSMDRAVVHHLVFLTLHVGAGWNLKQAVGDLGILLGDDPLVARGLEMGAAAFGDDAEHKAFELRARIIEGRGIADGLVYQEVARRLLARREFDLAYPMVIDLARGFSDPHDLVATAYDDVAGACLARLADHRFEEWPSGVLEALAPLGALAGPALAAPSTSALAISVPLEGLRAMPISEALAYWERRRAPGVSAITEARRGISRFVDLFGDLPVGRIERAQVIKFRDLIADMPPQTELKKLHAAGTTLRQAIDEHRAAAERWNAGDRQLPKPAKLSAGSVKKDVGSLSQILGTVAEDLGDQTHVAAGIKIGGYSKLRKGQAKPRLPFTPGMMQALFDSPLFTGCAGPSDAQRTRPGSHLYQDELYWPFLFGGIAGPRLEEIGQIALSDVNDCDMRRTFGDEYDGHCTFIHITGTGEFQEVKNDGSERYVVIHERLIELGFNDYVARRRAAGATRLFDLPRDDRGKHTKTLSNRLNRYIDRVVTKDPRYVFHSMRHEFTDRAEMSKMPTRVANSIKGHAVAGVADGYGLVTILAQYLFLKDLKVGFIDWPRLISAARKATADDGR